MKFIGIILHVCLLTLGLTAQDTLRYHVNLHTAEPGVLQVQCQLPAPGVWKLPAMVPGTYKVYNFGRFIEQVTAENSAINISTQAPNSWIFTGENTETTFNYRVQETWKEEAEEKSIFKPAGTKFIPGQVFLINTFAVFGYVDGKTDLPIRLELIVPDTLFAGSAMQPFSKHGDTLTFIYENYHSLADQPLLIAKPETALLTLGKTEILCMLYDPDSVSSARKISQHLKPMLEAQEQFLGGKLPVKNYAFLIYLDPDFNPFGSYGALEHNHSSVYYMPSVEEEYLLNELRDIAAHEFLHIVTPLNIHSEQIHNFNFDAPEMSRHLWLYEGVTEYNSALVQVQYDIMDETEFTNWIKNKIISSLDYNNSIPFTEMSLGVLDTFENEYQNVYEKGALIGLCLDLLIRKHRPDMDGINGLLKKLSEQYGKDTPFPDTALFDIIEQWTCPEAGTFLRKHVSGNAPLPLDTILLYAGYLYAEEKTTKGFTIGGVELGANEETQRLKILSITDRDDFGKAIGYKPNDEIAAWNGTNLNFENMEAVFTAFFETLKVGDTVQVTLERPKRKGKYKKYVKTAIMPMVEYTDYYYLRAIPNPTEEQKSIQKAWLRRFD